MRQIFPGLFLKDVEASHKQDMLRENRIHTPSRECTVGACGPRVRREHRRPESTSVRVRYVIWSRSRHGSANITGFNPYSSAFALEALLREGIQCKRSLHGATDRSCG
ncbi:hypothetical protein BDW42DRAFT_52552 [Aspergillus taichungensis]|uniref:Uncharacterized protein n=1 Tax=Aspergillus taichungensis TaxID=482145 RepID=A0A2J5I2H7_9EURO|nr:hypothetical protein BDW42DRAFT_52552 [Aspergillus taichungensis]